MSLASSFAALAILGKMRQPMKALPTFLGLLMEFKVSMMRIQNYLKCPEISESNVQEAPLGN